jgi:lipopolysaccharide/colanic/teichoic acid biosynthesis glycosyltransferase
MTKNERASKNWVGEGENRVTRVGAFLRRTSIDEVPQVLSVFRGDLSLIGPRSDILGLGERLREELPLYHTRYQVTPGISGWAQVNQRYAPGKISPQSIEESRVRLMYDLYYVKHHSLILDVSITLKTARTLVGRLIP